LSERDRLRRSWVANAPAWVDAVRGQRIESRCLVTDAAIVEAVLDQQPSTVLDLGCGEGWLARALASHGIEVTGVDASSR
jgi:2-polyprenyl-3-methyl-5-hydroxy-6-metoxy-1,4-benzoquinol methylase